MVGEYTSASLLTKEHFDWSDLERAPGNDEVRLISVEALNAEGNPVKAVNVEESVCIRLGFVVLKPSARFRCLVSVYTQGVCAFNSLEPTETTYTETGLYYASVTIPAHLFSENSYTVTVQLATSLGGKKRSMAIIEDALALRAIDKGLGTSVRGDYGHNLVDILRPRLAWETRYTGEFQAVASALELPQ
ncbi:MAG: hypothetical protein HC915_01345 [Anaerolineae bacterium]|nr:hypothetical protein [Anaerolineae bacterium]